MTKDEIRFRIWDYMEKNNLITFPKPCYGRIPNFIGAESACSRLLEIPEFETAQCIFTAPDAVLIAARRLILASGKTLLVALPHITDYKEIKGKELADKAITIQGLKRYGQSPKTPADLFIQGSVAVDLKGNRLGKGKGYGDREYEELKIKNLLKPNAKVITIVHECQIVADFSYLVREKDVKVNYILTPQRIIEVDNL
ncbi:MAG: 5-formyltetrahydrofolate cyclo-ligase [candidate division WOR-3 bacterium]|nr:5-formyltetrahydrofolate cyclo-ligase [candidate division WOR-3 bacterium]